MLKINDCGLAKMYATLFTLKYFLTYLELPFQSESYPVFAIPQSLGCQSKQILIGPEKAALAQNQNNKEFHPVKNEIRAK